MNLWVKIPCDYVETSRNLALKTSASTKEALDSIIFFDVSIAQLCQNSERIRHTFRLEETTNKKLEDSISRNDPNKGNEIQNLCNWYHNLISRISCMLVFLLDLPYNYLIIDFKTISFFKWFLLFLFFCLKPNSVPSFRNAVGQTSI